MSTRGVLVTGATRGLGREVASELLARGDRVFVTGRNRDAVERTVADLGGDAVGVRLDVTDQASVDEAADAVREHVDALDVLVNNAGIDYDTWQQAVTADLTVVDAALATNLMGAWRVTLAFLPLLHRSEHPRIVNVSSESGSISEMTGGTPAYAVSKAALNALTRLLAGELSSSGFLVNAACPGWIATDMGGPGGRPVAQGAASILWAVDLADDGPTGGYFRDGRALPW
ncbi:MAG TPA: SDR family NAD(P)-dependent oxidoreductase [Acidimicrobiia bacterium]|nr:SDR family NAD(P)-dependent oxidoreductase [Acidimicrobiia bacterium]